MGANIFRATQAEAKLRRENIIGEDKAGKTHYEVGKKVRKTIQELGGAMPENLPTVENINITKKRLKKAAFKQPKSILYGKISSKDLTNEAIDKAIYDL